MSVLIQMDGADFDRSRIVIHNLRKQRFSNVSHISVRLLSKYFPQNLTFFQLQGI